MTDFKIGDKVTTCGEAKENPNYHGVVVYVYKKWNTQNVYVQWPNWDEGDHMEYNACDINDGILVHWNEPVKRNPHAPDFALTLDDIKPGVKLRRVFNGKIEESITVTSKIYASKHGLGNKVDVEGELEEIYISDYGIEPGKVGGNCWYKGGNVYSIPDTTDAVLKVLQK